MPPKPVPFWDRVDKHTGHWYAGEQCWDYTGKHGNQFGHKSFKGADGKFIGAHVYAYQELVGPVPPGMVLDHLCERPCCVNPAHLEPKTQRDNLLRGATTLASINARKTTCRNGHEFTPENTRWEKNRNGHPQRACRRCHADRQLARYYRSRQQEEG